MGLSFDRHERCKRFIEAFNQESVDMHGIKSGAVISQGLDVSDSWHAEVYLFATLNLGGEEILVMLPTLFYDPNEPSPEAQDRLAGLLQLEREDVDARFAKLNL